MNTKPSPTIRDFCESIDLICANAIVELGKRSAAVAAKAARNGALSNNRIVFEYVTALEEQWQEAANGAMAELRRWLNGGKIARSDLRNVAEQRLRALIPQLVAERSAEQFSNQAMLASARERIAALPGNLDYRLRQFDIDMDVPASELPVSRWRQLGKWLGNHVAGVVVGIIATLLAALILQS